jgi:hypothetical protein
VDFLTGGLIIIYNKKASLSTISSKTGGHFMDDDIGKINPVNTGKDSMSIREDHTAISRPKAQKNRPKQVFTDVLHNKEEQITEEEKKRKQAPHAKYKDGKRIW